MIFLVGFGLNLLWEFLHAPLYLGGSYLQSGSVTYWTEVTGPFLSILLWASLWDGLLLFIIYGIVACIERQVMWVTTWRWRDGIVMIVVGMTLATFIEWRGLAEGRWGYGPLMPIVPFFDIGLTPFVQLAVTGIVAYRIAYTLYGGTDSNIS